MRYWTDKPAAHNHDSSISQALSAARAAELFFILGRGRSGTSLLREILNAHPQLVVAPEAMFIAYTWRKYRRGPWSDQRIESFVDDVFLESRFQNWNLDKTDLCESLKRISCAKRSFARMVAEIYRTYGCDVQYKPAAIYGDKNPTYASFGQLLQNLFPNAPVIALVRDPLDNVASFRRVPFDSSDVATLAWRWRLCNQRLIQLTAAFPHKALLIRYEDLVAKSQHTLTRICDHLGVAYEPRMLRFYERVDRRLEKWEQNLRRPLSTARIGKGRLELSDEQQQLAEFIVAPVARQLGYDLHAPARSPWLFREALRGRAGAAAWNTAERMALGLPARLRAWVVDAYRRRTGSLG